MKYTSYSEFEDAKSKCSVCSVGKAYDCVVLSDGCKTNPKVLIIGEAPGSDEVDQGKPFVGKSGKLLRSTLNEFGFRKNNSLITNTIPCRPENNKFPSDSKIVDACVYDWLKEEIALTKPSCILLIGATPLKFLLSKQGITSLRGNWQDYRGIPCMPTYHPSYVLRKEYMEEGKKIKEDFISDIRTVAIKAGLIKS